MAAPVDTPKMFGKWSDIAITTCVRGDARPQLINHFGCCITLNRSFEDIEIADISLEDYIAAKVRSRRG